VIRFADSQKVLNRWKNCFFQLLNVHRASNVRQREMHRVESSIPGPSHFEVEIAIAKLKSYKSPGTDKISTEMI
jgi:hypothetical protein